MVTRKNKRDQSRSVGRMTNIFHASGGKGTLFSRFLGCLQNENLLCLSNLSLSLKLVNYTINNYLQQKERKSIEML